MSAPIEPARVVPWAAVLGWCAVASAPAAISLMRGSSDLTFATVAAALVLGSGLATAIDDPARVTVAPVATPLWRRRVARLTWALVALTSTAAVIALAIALAGATTAVDFGHLLALATAAGMLSLAFAAHIRDDADLTTPGVAGGGAALVSILVLAALSQRFQWIPMPGMVDHTDRWWFVALVAALGAVTLLRDPASSHRLPTASHFVHARALRQPAVDSHIRSTDASSCSTVPTRQKP